jgi:Icc-related predicted phosphoesterase
MIYVVGDLHGNFERLDTLRNYLNPEDTVIQVGDFGFYPKKISRNHEFFTNYPCRILAIDGNHENFSYISEFEKDPVVNVVGNLHFVRRGTVLTIENKLFGFLGGADSIDREYRVKSGPSQHWWLDEQISQEDVNSLIINVQDKQLDYLITHAAPTFVVSANFAPLNLRDWNLHNTWKDVSSEMVSTAYWALRPHKLICGHMHKSVLHDNVRILDIDEAMMLD